MGPKRFLCCNGARTLCWGGAQLFSSCGCRKLESANSPIPTCVAPPLTIPHGKPPLPSRPPGPVPSSSPSPLYLVSPLALPLRAASLGHFSAVYFARPLFRLRATAGHLSVLVRGQITTRVMSTITLVIAARTSRNRSADRLPVRQRATARHW